MASFSVLIPIAILASSFMIGAVLFYILSPLEKAEKKEQLDAAISLLVNFVIYFWIGKILLNIVTFLHHPLTVLAYPGQSSAFYLAVLLSMIHIGVKKWLQKIDIQKMLHTFLYVFLFASFTYEFIQLIRTENHGNWNYLYLGLLFVLIMFVLFLEKHINKQTLIYSVFTCWSFGQLLLSIWMPYTTVFGYMMAPWFLSLLFIIGVVLLFISLRNRASS
ncbi:MAG TPA: hypothetical protein VK136_00330 [Bacillota bacterium]|nr:hypothetical protein [Bacillota bacterium]